MHHQRYSNLLRAAGAMPDWPNGAPFRPMPVHKESFTRSEDAVTDEGFFEGRQMPNGSYGSLPVLVNLNLSSRFSVTTTSTNEYIEVDFPSQYGYNELDCESSTWETVRGAERHFCLNIPPPPERRRRSESALPLSPLPPPSPSPPALIPSSRVDASTTKVGKNDEDGWVCVEVEHRVVHRVEHNIV
ncbi:hypothetical protein EVJ58_g6378 [Rhodofomes roseus]|uniref:Uncharacterized protein n=1 Tax=Rhodofomes roseus TaxID=34475 RepID=A0A4Y9Y8L4_9APHY|nr:hypothetical protein EVJ58_g6378 [Rhodofomes roseus]